MTRKREERALAVKNADILKAQKMQADHQGRIICPEGGCNPGCGITIENIGLD